MEEPKEEEVVPLVSSITELDSLLRSGTEAAKEFYTRTLKAPSAVVATFAEDNNNNDDQESGLRWNLMYAAWDRLKGQSGGVQKAAVRATVSTLLDDAAVSALPQGDHAKCLLILLHNPLFSSQPTYTILAHLLQQMTRLPRADHQRLVSWFRESDQLRLKTIIQVKLYHLPSS